MNSEYPNTSEQIRAHLKPWAGEVEVLIHRKRNGKIEAAKSLEFEEVGENGIQHGTLTIHEHWAQQLMDDLWQCGLRPSEGSGSAGAMAATQKHLEDLQKVLASHLKLSDILTMKNMTQFEIVKDSHGKPAAIVQHE